MESWSACIAIVRNIILRTSMPIIKNTAAVIDIRRCEVASGELPSKQSRLVLAWTELHQEDLLAVGSWRPTGNCHFGLNRCVDS